MIAISGELPAKLCGKVVGSDSYAAALLTRLKRERYVALRNQDGCRGYVLRVKGKRYVLETYGADTAFFLSGTSGTGHVKSELNKRMRLHRMSEVWVYLWQSGVCIFQSQKPDLQSKKTVVDKAVYYGSLEFKNDTDGIKGSRVCGVLLSGKSAYVIYNTMENRMKWAKKMERSMRVWLESMMNRKGIFCMADAIIFGTEIRFLPELLESDGGVRKNLFQVDDIYEHYYYIPMYPKAAVQLTLLLDNGKRNRLNDFLGGIVSYKKDKEYSLCDGYDSHGAPIYFCHELELRHLLRVKQELAWQQKGTVICMDYQEEVLKTYFGKEMKIQTVITDRLKEYLQQDT